MPTRGRRDVPPQWFCSLAEQDPDEATRPAWEARLECATAQRQRLSRLIEGRPVAG